MSNRLKEKKGRSSFVETYLGPKPSDFPVGSLQSRAAARAVLAAYKEEQREVEEAELVNLHPSALAFIEGVESPGVRSWTICLCRAAQETEKLYEKALPWPTAEVIRHNRAVFKEIGRMIGGEALSLLIRDSVEWNRWKAIAEENLGAKEK